MQVFRHFVCVAENQSKLNFKNNFKLHKWLTQLRSIDIITTRSVHSKFLGFLATVGQLYSEIWGIRLTFPHTWMTEISTPSLLHSAIKFNALAAVSTLNDDPSKKSEVDMSTPWRRHWLGEVVSAKIVRIIYLKLSEDGLSSVLYPLNSTFGPF